MTIASGRIVDSHLHLWDPARFEYPWLAGDPVLNRPFGPADLDTDGHELIAAVFVEGGRAGVQGVPEIEWIEEIAAGWARLRAAVAHADLEGGADVADDLHRLSRSPLVRGIRRNVQDEPDDFAIRPGFVAGTRLLADHGFTADLCVRHCQLPAAIELITRVLEVTFVLDHLGKPAVRDGVLDPWRENIRRLADLPSVVCKLSGLTSEADRRRCRTEDILPYLLFALSQFSADRCMFGSDRPVAGESTSYGRWVDVVEAALADRSPAESDQALRETAVHTYRINPV